MGMGTGSIQSFLLMWTPMTAAMMGPSALPFVVSLARRSQAWPLTTTVAMAAYLLVWTVFGIGVYLASSAISLPVPTVLAAGGAILFAGLYSLTPWMRAGQARCVAMCRERESLGVERAVAKGLVYGFNCVLCSTGVMLALVVVGMTNIAWVAVGAAVILVYKLGGFRTLASSAS
jgi:predicted metal-binding membrane protein